MSIVQYSKKSVLVTGANGYLGYSVASAFQRAGYRVYGLIRRATSAHLLHAIEVTPIVGSSATLEQVMSTLHTHTKTLDVIVGTTEQLEDYWQHHNDNIGLFRRLAERSNTEGVKPLLIFTSGCKDYGRTGLHGDTDLKPHTEDSPLDAPSFAVPRAQASVKVLSEHSDVFDVVTTRPTPLFGRSASFYGVMFDLAQEAARAETEDGASTWELPFEKNTIIHGAHVDDVAEAYVLLAKADRDTVSGEVYNMSGWRYETMGEVVEALKKEYGIQSEIKWVTLGTRRSFIDYSQWVHSEKIRRDTSWEAHRPLFSEAVGVYRRAYEEAIRKGDEGPQRLRVKLKRYL